MVPIMQPVSQVSEILRAPLIAGSGGGGGGKKGGGGGSESPNTLRTLMTAFAIDLWGEGDIFGFPDPDYPLMYTYMNDIVVQNPDKTFNFPRVAMSYRLGFPVQDAMPNTTVQTPLANFVAGEFYGAGGPNGMPELNWRQAVVDMNTSTVTVFVEVPALTYLNEKTGDLKGNSVDVNIDMRQTTGTNQSFVNVINDTIAGKCTSPYVRGYTITLPQPGPWELKAWRTKPQGFSNQAQQTNVLTVVRTLNDSFSYPNSAYAAIAVDAAAFNGAVPKRTYLLKGLNVLIPSNYDPNTRLYSTPVWDGSFVTAWTNNPAWIYYDLLTHPRRGLGDILDASLVDKWATYQIAQYCDAWMARPAGTTNDYGPHGMHGIPDGSGLFEPRFTFNGVLNTQRDAYTALQSIAACFRGSVQWGNGVVTLRCDQPTDVTQLLTPANVVDGTFTYACSRLTDRHSTAIVEYTNPVDLYRSDFVKSTNPTALRLHGYREIRVQALGCTSRSQAYRLADWLTQTEWNEPETVQYVCGLDQLLCRPGSIVAIADPAIAGARLGGCIVSGTVNSVTVDAPVTLEGGDEITIVMQNGNLMSAGITYATGGLTTLAVTPALPEAPTPGAMWVIDGGVVKTTRWRVIQVKEMKSHQFQVTAMQYDASKYDYIERGVARPTVAVTQLSTGPVNPPTKFSYQEALYRTNGSLADQLTIGWSAPVDDNAIPDARVQGYIIHWTTPSQGWTYLDSTSVPSYEIPNAAPGVYGFRVWPYTPVGQGKTPLEYLTVNVLGKVSPPAAVTGFAFTSQLAGVQLSWNPVADIDLAGYEVREGDSWDTAVPLTVTMAGTTLFVPLGDTDYHNYSIKAIDGSGNYSATCATLIARVAQPDDVTVFSVQPQTTGVIFAWNSVPGVDVEYEIRAGNAWNTAQPVVTVTATTYSCDYPGTGLCVFWIKSKSKLGLYSANPFMAECIVASANRNYVFTHDAGALGWSGTKRYTAYDSVSGTLSVQSAPWATLASANPTKVGGVYGEYFAEINLGASLTARNWIDCQFYMLGANSTTWATANFAWDSPTAQTTAWITSGDSAGGTIQRVISYKLASLPVSLVDGIEMNGNLTGAKGVVSSAVTGTVGYANHVVRQGLYLNTGATVTFTGFSLPATFATSCTFVLTSPDVSEELMRLTGSAGSLWVTRDTGGSITLHQSGTSATLSITPNRALQDSVIVAVSQTATSLSLAVYSLRTQDMQTVSVLHTPLSAGFTSAILQSRVTAAQTVTGNWVLSALSLSSTQLGPFAQAGATPIGYSAFTLLTPANYTYQNAIVGVFLGSPSGTEFPAIDKMVLSVDVPDVSESGSVTCTTGWTQVTLRKTWTAPPIVTAYQPSGALLTTCQTQNVTNTGFQVRIVQSTGTVIAGTAIYTCSGY